MPTQIPFPLRAEDFGLSDPSTSRVLPVLPLLFDSPRLYAPLAEAWDVRHPGTLATLRKLTADGWVAHQAGVVVDTRTGRPAAHATRPAPRYRTTAKGKRLLADATVDWRAMETAFPRATPENLQAVNGLLTICDVTAGDAAFGVSCPHATSQVRLPERTGRWWFAHLVDSGHLRRLDVELADVREVIPAHWRPTRMFAAQLAEAVRQLEQAPTHLGRTLRLRRDRFLGDIDPARVGVGGATDFDHDVTTQRVLASLLRSDRLLSDGVFAVEPRILLPLHTREEPWRVDVGGDDVKVYQPDAEIRERRDDGAVVRTVVEYERFQSRRDGWQHIAQFVGWAHTMTPAQPACLRFVLGSASRARSYVELIEAYADWTIDNPDTVPASDVTLAVSTVDQLAGAPDPLDDRLWSRIRLPRPEGEDHRCTGVPIHPRDDTPYDLYFSTTVAA